MAFLNFTNWDFQNQPSKLSVRDISSLWYLVVGENFVCFIPYGSRWPETCSSLELFLKPEDLKVLALKFHCDQYLLAC